MPLAQAGKVLPVWVIGRVGAGVQSALLVCASAGE